MSPVLRSSAAYSRWFLGFFCRIAAVKALLVPALAAPLEPTAPAVASAVGPPETSGAEPSEDPSAQPACRVFLERISYDDPGVDDEEWIELAVVAEDRPQSFGDCGIEALDLVRGQASSCSVYRRIPLREVNVPSGGRLLICSRDSTVFARYGCDLTHAGGAALPNGWLQNGLSAGLALVPRAESSDAGWAYWYAPGWQQENSEACLGLTWGWLAEDTGDIETEDGTVTDDVLTRCPTDSGDQFVRLPFSAAPPRQPAACPAPEALTEQNAAIPPTQNQEAQTAPAASSTFEAHEGTVLDQGVISVVTPVWIDAGNPAESTPQTDSVKPRSSPPEMGCGVRTKQPRAYGWVVLVLGFWRWCVVRRRGA